MSEYSLHHHAGMIRDRVRTDAYARALEEVVRPESVVLDLGAGTGILTLLAARAGARRIFAVEHADIIELARELAVANDLADRITFVQGTSTAVTLPEAADVVVSDLRGVLPLHRGHIPSIIDARRRHLVPAPTLIPSRDTLWAAPVELAAAYDARVSAWEAKPYGFEIAPARRLAANSWWRVFAPAAALLASPERLAVLDYRTIASPNIRTSAELEVRRAATLHGFVLWFDSELAPGAGFSTAPGKPETIYGQAFFPLLEPVETEPGDQIALAFSASLVGNDYLFRWDTRVAGPGGSGRVKAAFTQSTFFASPLSPQSLARVGERHVPTLTEAGEAAALVLASADGRRTSADLAVLVRQRFPDRFHSPEDALAFVVEVTRKYS